MSEEEYIDPKLVEKLFLEEVPHPTQKGEKSNLLGYVDHISHLFIAVWNFLRDGVGEKDVLEILKPEHRGMKQDEAVELGERAQTFITKARFANIEGKNPEITEKDVREALVPAYLVLNPENEKGAELRGMTEEIFETLGLELEKGPEGRINPETGKGRE